MENIDAPNITLDGHRMDAAIFAVEHKPSGRRLICATTCLSKRLWDQQNYLELKDHYNPLLQSDLVADGADAFQFVVLELVAEPSSLPALKRMHLEEARRNEKCYNPADPQCRQRVVISTGELRTTSTTNVELNTPLTDATERLKQLDLRVRTPEDMAAYMDRLIDKNWPRDEDIDK